MVYDGRRRTLRPISEFKRDGLWVCSACGTADKWRKGWAWYGSYRELDDHTGIREVLCARCADSRGIEVD